MPRFSILLKLALSLRKLIVAAALSGLQLSNSRRSWANGKTSSLTLFKSIVGAAPYLIKLSWLSLLLISLVALPPVSRAQFQGSASPDPGKKRPPIEIVPGEVLVRYRQDADARKAESETAAELPGPRGRIPMKVERFDGSDLVRGCASCEWRPKTPWKRLRR
ncbi:MAG TPA: hypothetical protein VGX92_13515 [Pyrinomonadaceae bacterium]|jgi:hypothetical protein|nr:hypothetical protein [Pyrinomonadaceae bacterium]